LPAGESGWAVTRQPRIQFPNRLDCLPLLWATLLISLAQELFDLSWPIARRRMVAVVVLAQESEAFPTVCPGEPGPKGNYLVRRRANSQWPMLHPHQQNLINFRQPGRGFPALGVGSASAFHEQTPLHIVCLDYVHADCMSCTARGRPS
jgi:hypothetical protein